MCVLRFHATDIILYKASIFKRNFLVYKIFTFTKAHLVPNRQKSIGTPYISITYRMIEMLPCRSVLNERKSLFIKFQSPLDRLIYPSGTVGPFKILLAMSGLVITKGHSVRAVAEDMKLVGNVAAAHSLRHKD